MKTVLAPRIALTALAGIADAMQKRSDNQTSDKSACYQNCSAARAAGAAPIYRGEPGYRPALDREQ
jgi:hypothetical protein